MTKLKTRLLFIPLIIMIVSIFFIIYSAKVNGTAVVKNDFDDKAISLASQMTEKDSIKFKMLNASSFYDAAKGSFDQVVVSDGKEYISNISYNLNYKDSLAYVVSTSNTSKDIVETIVDKEIYQEYTTKENDKNTKWTGINGNYNTKNSTENETIQMKLNRIDKSGEEIKVQLVGDYLPTPAFNSTYPQQLAVLCLDDSNEWNIIGTQKFLDRDVYVINGTISSDISGAKSFGKFEIYVDKETGIVLQYIVCDSKGNILEKLITNDIAIISKGSATNDANILGSSELKSLMDKKQSENYVEQNPEKNPKAVDIINSEK